MLVKKAHLYGVIAILSVAGILYLQENTHDTATNQVDDANVASCIRNVTRDAYQASALLTLSGATHGRASKRYKAAALSIADTFPKTGTAVDGQEMIQVQFVQGPGDVVRLRLTDQAAALIREGCRQAF